MLLIAERWLAFHAFQMSIWCVCYDHSTSIHKSLTIFRLDPTWKINDFLIRRFYALNADVVMRRDGCSDSDIQFIIRHLIKDLL